MERPGDGEPSPTGANDNASPNRDERLSAIRRKIEEKGGVDSKWAVRMQHFANWRASHWELLKQDAHGALTNSLEIMRRVPERVYANYRNAKIEGKYSFLTEPADLALRAYIDVRQFSRSSATYGEKCVNGLRNLYERGVAFKNDVVVLCRNQIALGAKFNSKSEKGDVRELESRVKELQGLEELMLLLPEKLRAELARLVELRESTAARNESASKASHFFSSSSGNASNKLIEQRAA